MNFDLLRAADAVAPLWAAGFYNKTFKWPSWHIYEPLIRRMAGLGTAPAQRDPDRYQVLNHHCDVLIIGAASPDCVTSRLHKAEFRPPRCTER